MALWGPNAVNGVINVITKHASRSQGLLVQAGVGTFERLFGTIRFGERLNDKTWMRAYVKHAERDRFRSNQGIEPRDDWSLLRGGDLSPQSHLGNQSYYARANRSRIGSLAVFRETGDLDLRHNFRWHSRAELVWGIGYRHIRDQTDPGPDVRLFDLFSAILQNTAELIPSELFGMIGSKLTHFTVTGWVLQPSARVWWVPDPDRMVWGAVSRPVRVISTPPIPIGSFNNDGSGASRGAELAAGSRILPPWRVRASYRYLEVEHEGPILRFEQRNAPMHLATLRSQNRPDERPRARLRGLLLR